ncbi:hypothetical protein BSNT_09071 [Bacillus subtilis subsp. natto BEST195]|nr:hypothetical protein BSNT_09071 [Bacillus subtilis subsp. natto BEST195]
MKQRRDPKTAKLLQESFAVFYMSKPRFISP